jgi:hypothetical protein
MSATAPATICASGIGLPFVLERAVELALAFGEDVIGRG